MRKLLKKIWADNEILIFAPIFLGLFLRMLIQHEHDIFPAFMCGFMLILNISLWVFKKIDKYAIVWRDKLIADQNRMIKDYEEIINALLFKNREE